MSDDLSDGDGTERCAEKVVGHVTISPGIASANCESWSRFPLRACTCIRPG